MATSKGLSVARDVISHIIDVTEYDNEACEYRVNYENVMLFFTKEDFEALKKWRA